MHMACLPPRLIDCPILAYNVCFIFYLQGRPSSHMNWTPLDLQRCQMLQVVPFASAFRPVLPTRRDSNTNISRSSLPSSSPISAFHPVGNNPPRPGPNPGGNVTLQSQPSGSGVLLEQPQPVSESADSPAAAAAAARGQMQPQQQQAQAAS